MIGIGIGIGRNRFGASFATIQWQLLTTTSWNNITDTWN
jgi:hypothetical protein